jgi:NAD(P)-dependent dehydrogenase (short-subunit alcohol dehydrogenase family)
VLKYGPFYGLVNNAGIALAAPLEHIPIEDFRRQFEVNVIGQLGVTQAFLPLLRPASGRVIFIGSIAGRLTVPFLGPYSSSKFAIEAMTDALRVELQPWNIHVVLVEPGTIATPIWKKGADEGDRMQARFAGDVVGRYRSALEAIRKAAAGAARRGIPAEEVATLVEHALTNPSPRTRYLVGADAKQRAWIARLVPDRLRDRLLTRILGLPRRGEYAGRS